MKRAVLALAAASLLFVCAPALAADDAGAPKPAAAKPTRPTPPTKPTAPTKTGPAAVKPAATKPAPPAAKPAAAATPTAKPATAKPADSKPVAVKPAAKPATEVAKPEPKRPDEDAFDDDDDAKPAAVAPASAGAASSSPVAPAGPVTLLDVHTAPPPDQSLTYRDPLIIPTPAWIVSQLLPSPELVVGRQTTIAADGSKDGGPNATWGIRWQVTPLLWSWGVHRKQNPWRMLVVDPLARVSGSIEVWTAVEYIGGDISRPFVRPGVRGYFPLLDRGEYLSTSIGTSIYRFDNALRVAYDVGLYVFSGIFGINVTIAPTHAPMTSIFTFNLRYF